MEKQTRSIPLLAITCFLLVITLTYVAFLAAYDSPSDQWTKWFPNSWGDGARQDSLKLLLRRLVKGDDINKLETNSFACDRATHSVVCVANQHVGVETANLTVHIPSYKHTEPKIETLVQPYARQEDKELMRLITPVHILEENIRTAKSCNYTHKVPVIVFSSGLIGNLFHEVSEIIIPLFITSRHFNSSVQFMIIDYQPWFVKKYNRILTQLSSYQVIGGGLNSTSAHCFPGAVVGLKYHDNLALDPNSIPGGYTMLDFKQFLRETYSLKIKNANEINKPVLLLISRKTSRTFLNEDEMVQMMEKMGFQVFVTNTKEMLNLDKFSKVVNSCNVMVGAHGAGLTNAVFLPEGAVLVQVVPYALTWASDTYYGQPAPKMGLKYLEYKTVAEESSLMGSYGLHDPVIADPQSLYSRGYQAVRAIYVDGQNMTINLTKFRVTLVEALVHLGHLPLTRKS